VFGRAAHLCRYLTFTPPVVVTSLTVPCYYVNCSGRYFSTEEKYSDANLLHLGP
jgi:hypothetical protein